MIINDEDVVIVGAGAAGVGAGLALSRMGVPYIILEANHRIGGRAHTDADTLGHIWDRGCHWFHSGDINPLREIADQVKHEYRSETTNFLGAIFDRDQWADQTEIADADAAFEAYFKAVHAASEAGRDVSMASLLDAENKWSPLIEATVAQLFASEAVDVTTSDQGGYLDTEINYSVSGGMGALIEYMARGLRVRTECEVNYIRTHSEGVDVGTTDDSLVRASAAIVTVSTEVLKSGKIEFEPAMPDELRSALDAIELGNVEKVALLIDGDPFGLPHNTFANLISGEASDRPIINAEIMPNGRPLAIVHVAGTLARELEAEGEATMVDFAITRLTEAFGQDISKHVLQGTATNWSSNPHVLGGYASVRPGHHGARDVLRQPIAERVFLAGEATSAQSYATCHGAYLSGIDAAHAAAEKAGHWPCDKEPLWLPQFS